MSLHTQAEMLIYQLLVNLPFRHVDSYDASVLWAFHVEVHLEMVCSQLIDFDSMSQAPGSGPLTRRWFSICFDLVRRSKKFDAAGVCLDSIHSVIELAGLAVSRKQLLIEKVEDYQL